MFKHSLGRAEVLAMSTVTGDGTRSARTILLARDAGKIILEIG